MGRHTLESLEERYRIALQASGDYIFEYDTKEDELTCYGNGRGTEQKVYKKFVDGLDTGKCSSRGQLELLEEFLMGQRQNAEIKIKDGWYSFVGKAVCEDGIPVRVTGRISNITETKQEEENRLKESVYDELTGALKPAVGLGLIQQFMDEKSDKYAVIYYEIINMSRINSTYGMLFGDAAIKFTAEEIRKCIGEDDLSVRIGGCRFLMLCKNCGKTGIPLIADKLFAVSQKVFSAEAEKTKAGIVIMPGRNWDGYPYLPQLAEDMRRMLKERRNAGIFYIEETSAEVLGQRISYSKYRGMSPCYSDRKIDLLSFASAFLEKEKCSRSAVQMLMETVGRVKKLKFIRIMDVDCVHLTKYLTYEWADSMEMRRSEKAGRYRNYEIVRELADVFAENAQFVLIKGEKAACSLPVRQYLEAEHPARRLYCGLLWADRQKKQAKVIVFASDRESGRRGEKEFYDSLIRILTVHISREQSGDGNKIQMEFLSRVSHEIKTPIHGIIGMLELLKNYMTLKNESTENGSLDGKIYECLEKADTSAAFLMSIVNDIMELSGLENRKLSLKTEAFHMEELAKKLEAMFFQYAKECGLDFEIVKEYDMLYVVGDLQHILQILANLVQNAFRNTPQGGKVTVTVCQNEQKEGKIAYHFSVKDTGCGYSREERESLFASFMQPWRGSSESLYDTGMGLSISRILISMMRGELELSSSQGEGAEFYFDLQLPFATGEDGEMKAAECDKMDFCGRRLLLVEDNEVNAEIAAALLKMKGFEVEWALDGAIAVDMFGESAAGYYDAIIMDIRMPNMDGLTATRKIRDSSHKDGKRVPIIAMTSDIFDDEKEHMAACGMNGYLSKPVKPEEVYDTLNNVLLCNTL